MPKLNLYPLPESVVIVDNLIVHKCPVLMESLYRHGIHYMFLPPYSPFFNPIEECFGFVKTLCHRQYEQFQDVPMADAIYSAFTQVTPALVEGFFRHAGYE